MAAPSEDVRKSKKRVFATRIGCALVACGLAVAAVWLGWPVYKDVVYTRMVYDVLDNIRSLRLKRPANVTAENWECAVGWAQTAVCNLPLGGPENPAPMRQFRRALDERIAAGDSLAVVRWIWDELERRNVRAREYALLNKPLRAMTPDPISDDTLGDFWGAATCGCLDLSDTQITDSGVRHLKKMTDLFDLQLNRTRVTDAGLPELASLPQLRFLGLAGCTITDAGLAELKRFGKLKWLSLESTNVTDDGVKRLQEALPDCTIVR